MDPINAAEAARRLGISPGAFYRSLPEIGQGHADPYSPCLPLTCRSPGQQGFSYVTALGAAVSARLSDGDRVDKESDAE